MNKNLKIAVLMVIMACMLMLLTACGNKLTAEREMTLEKDGMEGKVTIEVTFKDDKAETMEEIMEYKDEETAENTYSLLKTIMDISEDSNLKLNQTGNKIILSTSGEGKLFEDSEAQTKQEVKEYLESEGFKVK